MQGIGIDLGNSNTRVASVSEDGKTFELFDFDGKASFPSYVFVDEEGKFVVGDEAKNQEKNHPENTINNIKRFLGADYNKCVEEGQPYPFLLVPEKKLAAVQCETKEGKITLKPEDLHKQIFLKIQAHPKTAGKKAVITYPPYLSPQQRELIRTAAKQANITVDSMVPDPVAAIAAYEDQLGAGKHTVLVFDFSQTDTIVSIFKGEGNNYKQLSVAGDSVGGDDVNSDAAAFLSREFRVTYKQNLSRNEKGMKLLRDAIEVAKKEFPQKKEIELNIPGIIEGVDYKDTVSLEKFEYMTEDAYGRAADQITVALEHARLSKDKITHVILSGGSSRIDRMKFIVQQVTGKKPLDTIDPENVVVIGAAKLASK